MGILQSLLQQVLNELRRINSTNAANTREIMDVSQAAEYLGFSEYSMREMVRMRQIPFHRVKKSIRFRKSKLDRWIDRSEIGVRER
ncbi:MAG: helix-turn-helix domain-containing protein [bacterium]|nr:helix-turn-helix domain-containing protein [bacterium]